MSSDLPSSSVRVPSDPVLVHRDRTSSDDLRDEDEINVPPERLKHDRVPLAAPRAPRLARLLNFFPESSAPLKEDRPTVMLGIVKTVLLTLLLAGMCAVVAMHTFRIESQLFAQFADAGGRGATAELQQGSQLVARVSLPQQSRSSALHRHDDGSSLERVVRL